MKLKLKGSKIIEVLESIEIDDFKEYLLAFICSPDGTFQPAKSSEETEEPVRFMRIIRPEILQEVGTKKKIEIRQGKTQSQYLRFTIEELAAKKGLDIEKFYQNEMNRIILHYKEKLI